MNLCFVDLKQLYFLRIPDIISFLIENNIEYKRAIKKNGT